MGKFKKIISLILVISFASILMMGCSNKKEEKVDTGGTQVTDTDSKDLGKDTEDNGVQADGEVLKLGLVAPITGENKLVGEYMVNGFELALEQINSEGGILGKKLELVVTDEVDNLQDSVNAMSKLLSNDEIMGIVGSLYSTYCIAALPEVAKAKVPFFSSGSSSGVSDEKNPYTWQVRPIDTFQGIALADLAIDTLGMKNPAIMYSTQSALASLEEQVEKALKDRGLDITEKNLFAFPDEETNYAPYFAQILAGDYDGIIALTNQMPAALVCQQAEIAGVDPEVLPCLGSTSYASNVCISNAGSSSNGWYSVADWVPGGATEAAAAFEDAYVAKFGTPSDLPAVSVYDAVNLIKEACEISGATDRESINEGLKQIKNYPGAISTFSYFDDHVFATALGITQNIDEVPVMIDAITFREP